MKRNIIISVIIGTLATYLPFWQWDGLQVAGALALSMLAWMLIQGTEPEGKPAWEKASQRRKENAQKNRERKLNEFEIAFQNIEFDGREISASELAEALETSAKELLSWLGEGKRQKKELRNKFEKYFGEDGKTYIRRKGAQECSQP